jgi:hypothetical protein
MNKFREIVVTVVTLSAVGLLGSSAADVIIANSWSPYDKAILAMNLIIFGATIRKD